MQANGLVPPCDNRGVKTVAAASTAKRLAALEQQFTVIAKMTKGLGRHLDEVAETVRIAVDELRSREPSVRRLPGTTSRRRSRA